MNELSILMQLLSNKSNIHVIGTTKEEILKTLNITNKNKDIYFQELITNLSNYIEPLGLQVRYNPLNSHWFLSHDSEISDLVKVNPFDNKPSLAATLFCIIASCFKKSKGETTISEIKIMRNIKNIKEDLRELQKLGYIILNKDSKGVRLSPLIGYQLDLEKLLIKLGLKVKE
ncbi:MAG: hypothetical protein EU539_14025 [Promethearchaeota archaeon]|nr:MAG: hypothetical protein EU539_14025 [Candidatus Lokiarchaeota archaeon]